MTAAGQYLSSQYLHAARVTENHNIYVPSQYLHVCVSEPSLPAVIIVLIESQYLHAGARSVMMLLTSQHLYARISCSHSTLSALYFVRCFRLVAQVTFKADDRSRRD